MPHIVLTLSINILSSITIVLDKCNRSLLDLGQKSFITSDKE
jgi:hypothetical protein